MQIAGLAAILVAVFVWVCYIHYDQLGSNAHLGELFAWTFGTAAAGFLFYVLMAIYKRSRGTDITLVYREIPPE